MAFIKVAILIVSASLLMTAARAAPAADSQPQVVAQPGGAILVPVSRLAHTQIQGVPYVILSANAAQQFSPGRFFLRSAAVAGAPTVAFGPPGPAAFSFGPPAPSPVAFGPPAPSPVSFGPPAPAPGAVQAPQQTFVRIAQPAPAPAAVLSAPVPPPALAPAVLVRKEVVEPGRKLAVFRKPVAAAQEDSSNEKIIRGPPQPYSFSYQIHGETGDQKSASETSDGNTIVGSYSLVEPDGTLRVVKYQADPINGFTAQVERTAGAFPAIPDPVRKPENANDS